MKTDAEMLDWLEQMHNLHTDVVIIYVVDGYEVYVEQDGRPMGPTCWGETLREAINRAMEANWV